MTKYSPSDDGKVIDGKTVVWLYPPGSQEAQSGATTGGSIASTASSAKPRRAPLTPAEKQVEKLATANAAAASLAAAAESGVPFCAECEAARKAMAG
jgi:hypothetical protein